MSRRPDVRTVGVEEELLVVDPGTGEAVPSAGRVLRRLEAPDDEDDDIGPELFRHQVETRSAPALDLDEVLADLRAARDRLAGAARAAGRRVVAAGVAPLLQPPVVTDDDRYREMVDTFGSVTLGAGTCAMHVHVQVHGDDEAVGVVDRLRPWLATLLAASANSPLAEGRDTGYASWRTHLWSRWPTAGPGEPFGTVEEYRRVSEHLVASGAARDSGMLYFDARLAVEHPTVEVRVCDVLTDPEVAVSIAALVRALVETAAREHAAGEPVPHVRVETMRAARWRASRFGLGGELLDPLSGEVRPAGAVVAATLDHADAALRDAGDLDRVTAALHGLLDGGTGADAQRRVLEADGEVRAVVADLARRTAGSR